MESKIRALELDKIAFEAKFHDTSLSQDDITKMSLELEKIINELEEKEARWFEISEKLEN